MSVDAFPEVPAPEQSYSERLSLVKLLWPYIRHDIPVVVPPEEAIERVRSFIAYESLIGAELEYRTAKGKFFGKARGLRFRMMRVMHHGLMPYIFGRVMQSPEGNTLVRLRFTIGGAYVMNVVGMALVAYCIATRQVGPGIAGVALLEFLCALAVGFWHEVDRTIDELCEALQPQPRVSVPEIE